MYLTSKQSLHLKLEKNLPRKYNLQFYTSGTRTHPWHWNKSKVIIFYTNRFLMPSQPELLWKVWRVHLNSVQENANVNAKIFFIQ